MVMMIAQAILEKGVLDGAATGLSSIVDNAASVFQARPWILVVIAIAVGLFIFRRRR